MDCKNLKQCKKCFLFFLCSFYIIGMKKNAVLPWKICLQKGFEPACIIPETTKSGNEQIDWQMGVGNQSYRDKGYLLPALFREMGLSARIVNLLMMSTHIHTWISWPKFSWNLVKLTSDTIYLKGFLILKKKQWHIILLWFESTEFYSLS